MGRVAAQIALVIVGVVEEIYVTYVLKVCTVKCVGACSVMIAPESGRIIFVKIVAMIKMIFVKIVESASIVEIIFVKVALCA